MVTHGGFHFYLTLYIQFFLEETFRGYQVQLASFRYVLKLALERTPVLYHFEVR